MKAKITEHKINLESEIFGIIGSPNIRRLERILGVSIVERVNTELMAHINKISQYKFITEKQRGIFNLYIKPPRKPKKLFLSVKNGLLWNNSTPLALVSYKKIRHSGVFNQFKYEPVNYLPRQEINDINGRINELANQDIKTLKNRSNPDHPASKYFMSKLNILTTLNRISQMNRRGEIKLPDLIWSWDIEKPIEAKNRFILYKISRFVNELIMPEYLASLEKNKNLYSTASKMQISHQSLLVVPRKYRDRFFALYQKYPLAHSLVTRYKDLVKFDSSSLIINDAHPKLIKELVVDFYQKISPIPLAKNMITKVLRLHKVAFSRKHATEFEGYYSLFRYYVPLQNDTSFDLFLLAMFSNMPQLEYLGNKEKKSRLDYYGKTFITLLRFLKEMLHIKFIDCLKICRNSLNSSNIDYKKYCLTIDQCSLELERLEEEIDNISPVKEAIAAAIKSQNKVTIKFLNKAHDSITAGIRAYWEELHYLHLPPLQLELANTKIIDKESYQNYIFEQLVTKDELSKEGSFMHHCVDSYFGSNLNLLFIFAVYPQDGDRTQKTDKRSTLAIQVNYKKHLSITIEQNYTFCNDTPEGSNRIVCHSFIKYIREKYESKFIEYIDRLNDSQKVMEQTNSVNLTDVINQIADNLWNINSGHLRAVL